MQSWVKKGEKGIFVVFNKMIERQVEKDGQTKIEKKAFLRYYKVFNLAQCTDIPNAFIPPREDHDIEPLYECERIIEAMADCPLIRHETHEAFYLPALDYIIMPPLSSFDSSPDYYGTLFHELIHSTGHQKRIGSKEVYQNPDFGTEMYSLEELVAEMGSCYLKLPPRKAKGEFCCRINEENNILISLLKYNFLKFFNSPGFKPL